MLQSFFADPTIQNAFFALKTIFIIADILLVGAMIYAFIQSLEYRPQFTSDTQPTKRTLSLQVALLRERWQAISKRFNAGVPESIRLAIIEADAYVDDVLKRMGLGGETMADRLMRLNPDDVKSLNRIWRAHKLRNDLVHTPGFPLSPGDAQSAMRDYEAFLEESGIL